MGVQIDKPGGNDPAFGVDHARCVLRIDGTADFRDFAADNADVMAIAGSLEPIDDGPVFDDQVEFRHGCSLPIVQRCY